MEDEEKKFTVRLVKQKQIDRTTFNALCRFKRRPSSSYLHTIRKYPHEKLPRHIHAITNAINDVSVARSVYLDISREGLPSRIFFVPFYEHTFEDWEKNLASETEEMRNTKVKKASRSIIRAVDLLHRHHQYDIGLEQAIRIDDKDNAQIVLHKNGTGSMQVGVPKDILAFKNLVDKLYGTEEESNTLGYQYFNDLYSHFSSRNDKFDEKGSLRSFSYFIFHNPLFYEVTDRYNCIYKMKMFRDLNQSDFDNSMSSSVKGLENWLKNVKKSEVLEEIYDNRVVEYLTHASILKFFNNCYYHGQKLGQGISEVQQELDRTFPGAIYILFLAFVVEIESNRRFHGVNVLHYFKSVSPSPDLT